MQKAEAKSTPMALLNKQEETLQILQHEELLLQLAASQLPRHEPLLE
jgi:hypothetical protein